MSKHLYNNNNNNNTSNVSNKIAAAEKQQAITQQTKKQSAAEEVLQGVKGEKYIGEGVTEASLNRLLAKDPLLNKYDLAKNINLINLIK